MFHVFFYLSSLFCRNWASRRSSVFHIRTTRYSIFSYFSFPYIEEFYITVLTLFLYCVHHKVHVGVELKQREGISPLSWRVHHNFEQKMYMMVDIVKKGWACTPPPPLPARADFSIMMESTPESGRCRSVCTLWCSLITLLRWEDSNFFVRNAMKMLKSINYLIFGSG